MPDPLKTQAASVTKAEVVVLKHHGHQFRVLSPMSLVPGKAVMLKVDGESLQCEVAASIPPQGERSKCGKQMQESVPVPSQSPPDWDARDSVESVMGSLIALNAQLTFYEEHGRAS